MVDALGYIIILYLACCSGRNNAECNVFKYKQWASVLLSGYDQAMREASNGRTVTDTESCAFLFLNLRPTRG